MSCPKRMMEQEEEKAFKRASLSLNDDYSVLAMNQQGMRSVGRTLIVYMIDATASMRDIISGVCDTICSTVALSRLMPRTDVKIVIYKDYDTACNGLTIHHCDTIHNTQTFLQKVSQESYGGEGGSIGYEASASGLLVALDLIDINKYSGALIYNITDEDGRFDEKDFKEKSREVKEFNEYKDVDIKSLDNSSRFKPSSIIREFHEKNVKFLTLMCITGGKKNLQNSFNAGYLQLERAAVEFETHENSTIHRVCVLETCRENIKEVALDVIMTDITRSSSHSSFGMQIDLQSMFGQELRNVNNVKDIAPNFGLEDFNRKYVNIRWFNKNPKVWKRDDSNTDIVFFYFTIYPTNTIESKYEYMSFFALDETALVSCLEKQDSIDVQKIMYQKAASIVKLLSENQDLCMKLAGIPIFCSLVTSFIESHGKDPMNCNDHKVSQTFKTLIKKHSRQLSAYYVSDSGRIETESRDAFSSLKMETAEVYAQTMIAVTVASTHNTTEVNPLTHTVDVGLFYLDNENDHQPMMPPTYDLLNVRGPRVINWITNFLKRIRHQNKTDNKIGLGESTDGKRLICIPAYEYCHRSDTNLKYSPLQAIFTLLDKNITLRRAGFNLLLVASLILNNSERLCPELVEVAKTTLSNCDNFDEMVDEYSCLLPCFFSNEHRNILIQESTLSQIKSQTVINQLMASSQLEKAMLVCKKQSSFKYHQKLFRADVTSYEKSGECQLKICQVCKKELLAEHFINVEDESCGYCMCCTIDSRLGQQVCEAFQGISPEVIQNYYEKQRRRCSKTTFGTLLKNLGHNNLITKEEATAAAASETSSRDVLVVRLACSRCKNHYPVVRYCDAPRYSKNHLCPRCHLLKALKNERYQNVLAIYASHYVGSNLRHCWNISYLLHHVDALIALTAGRAPPEPVAFLREFLQNEIVSGTNETQTQMKIKSQQTINEYQDATICELMTPDQFDQLIFHQTGLQNLDLLKGSWSNVAQLPTSYTIMKTHCKEARLYADLAERKRIVEDGVWVTTDTAKKFLGEIPGNTISECEELLCLKNCNLCFETNIGTLYNVHCTAMLCDECIRMYQMSRELLKCPLECPLCRTVLQSFKKREDDGKKREK